MKKDYFARSCDGHMTMNVTLNLVEYSHHIPNFSHFLLLILQESSTYILIHSMGFAKCTTILSRDFIATSRRKPGPMRRLYTYTTLQVLIISPCYPIKC